MAKMNLGRSRSYREAGRAGAGAEVPMADLVENAPACGGTQRRKKLDPLVRYMIFHWFLGMLGGALCVTLLLVFDPFGIWPLIHDSGLGVPAIFLLYIGFMTSFGGLRLRRGGDVSAGRQRRYPARRLAGQCDPRRLEAPARLRARPGRQVTRIGAAARRPISASERTPVSRPGCRAPKGRSSLDGLWGARDAHPPGAARSVIGDARPPRRRDR